MKPGIGLLIRVKKNWLVLLASLIYLGKAVLFFHQNPNFTLFWDWPGHLQRARVISWSSFARMREGGWDTTFWGGYPTITYPGLYHLLLKTSVTIAGSEWLGAVILTLVVFTAQLHSLRRFIKTLAQSRWGKLYENAAFLGAVAMMSLSAGSLMGSFRGTVFTGGGPGALGTAMLLYFLASRNWIHQAVWLGLLFLSHPLSAAVALIYWLAKLSIAIRKMKIKTIKKLVFCLIWGLLIGLPWILPQIDPAFETTAINLHGTGEWLPWGIMVVLWLAIIQDLSWLSPLVLLMLAVGTLSVLPLRITRLADQVGVRGIHFFRFQWYLFLLCPLVFSSLAASVKSRFRAGEKLKRSTKAAATAVALLTIAVGSQPTEKIWFDFDYRSVESLSGRVMDVSRHSTAFGIPQAMEHELVKNTGLIGSTRWIFESGSRGQMFYDLKDALDPNSFRDGVYLDAFSNRLGERRLNLDIKRTADLLGVEYVSFTASRLPEKNRDNLWYLGKAEALEASGNRLTAHYFLEKITDSPLAVTLDKIPRITDSVDLGEWWTGMNWDELAVEELPELPRQQELDFSQPEISSLAVYPDRIALAVNSDQPAPVLLKFSYSPYWTARAIDDQGWVSSPVWITPGHLLVFARGNIELNWETPSYLITFTPVSGAVLLALGLFSLTKRTVGFFSR